MGIYSRVIFPRLCDAALNRPLVEAHRRKLLSDATGDILEIGFGTGLNLPCYPDHVRKIAAVEPNAGMHRQARARVQQTGIDVHTAQLSSEQLPYEAGSFDTVVSTFTLCSIGPVDRALEEIYRVLKPQGRFLFLEHGLSPEPGVRRWQRRLNRLQRFLADNCHLDRDIQQLVSGQPYRSIQAQAFYLSKTPKTHGYLTQGMAQVNAARTLAWNVSHHRGTCVPLRATPRQRLARRRVTDNDPGPGRLRSTWPTMWAT